MLSETAKLIMESTNIDQKTKDIVVSLIGITESIVSLSSAGSNAEIICSIPGFIDSLNTLCNSIGNSSTKLVQEYTNNYNPTWAELYTSIASNTSSAPWDMYRRSQEIDYFKNQLNAVLADPSSYAISDEAYANYYMELLKKYE